MVCFVYKPIYDKDLIFRALPVFRKWGSFNITEVVIEKATEKGTRLLFMDKRPCYLD